MSSFQEELSRSSASLSSRKSALSIERQHPATNRCCSVELFWRISLHELCKLRAGSPLHSAEIEILGLPICFRLVRSGGTSGEVPEHESSAGTPNIETEHLGVFVEAVEDPTEVKELRLWEREVSFRFEFIPMLSIDVKSAMGGVLPVPKRSRVGEGVLSNRKKIIGFPNMIQFSDIKTSYVHTTGSSATPESRPADKSVPRVLDLVVLSIKINVRRSTASWLEKVRQSALSCRSKYGVVGLVNHGATCFLNVALQALFHLNFFRREIYNLGARSSHKSNVAKQLQHVFYSLETSAVPPTTLGLVKAMRINPGVQCDTHELLNEFFLHRVFKHIADLFSFNVRFVTSCVEVDFSTATEEKLYEFPLSVSGVTVEESIQKELAEEPLSDLYDTGNPKWGKQKASRQMQIISLPVILFFHVKRFNSKAQKIHASQALSKIITFGGKRFLLQSAIVHRGIGIAAGHYVAIIRLGLHNDNFFLFDDESVEPMSGEELHALTMGTHWMSPTSSSYVLVYVQEDMWGLATKDFSPCPPDLVKELVADKEVPLPGFSAATEALADVCHFPGAFFAHHPSRLCQPPPRNVRVLATSICLSRQVPEMMNSSSIGVVEFDIALYLTLVKGHPVGHVAMEVHQSMRIADLRNELVAALGIKHRTRSHLIAFTTRENGTLRPSFPLYDRHPLEGDNSTFMQDIDEVDISTASMLQHRRSRHYSMYRSIFPGDASSTRPAVVSDALNVFQPQPKVLRLFLLGKDEVSFIGTNPEIATNTNYNDGALLFLKIYCGKVIYLHSAVFAAFSAKISEVCELLASRAQKEAIRSALAERRALPAGSLTTAILEAQIFEEVRPERMDLLLPDETIESADLTHGDVLVVALSQQSEVIGTSSLTAAHHLYLSAANVCVRMILMHSEAPAPRETIVGASFLLCINLLHDNMSSLVSQLRHFLVEKDPSTSKMGIRVWSALALYVPISHKETDTSASFCQAALKRNYAAGEPISTETLQKRVQSLQRNTENQLESGLTSTDVSLLSRMYPTELTVVLQWHRRPLHNSEENISMSSFTDTSTNVSQPVRHLFFELVGAKSQDTDEPTVRDITIYWYANSCSEVRRVALDAVPAESSPNVLIPLAAQRLGLFESNACRKEFPLEDCLRSLLLRIERKKRIEAVVTYDPSLDDVVCHSTQWKTVKNLKAAMATDLSLRLVLCLNPCASSFFLASDVSLRHRVIDDVVRNCQAAAASAVGAPRKVEPLDDVQRPSYHTASNSLVAISHVNVEDGYYMGQPMLLMAPSSLGELRREMYETVQSDEPMRFTVKTTDVSRTAVAPTVRFEELVDEAMYRRAMAALHEKRELQHNENKACHISELHALRKSPMPGTEETWRMNQLFVRSLPKPFIVDILAYHRSET